MKADQRLKGISHHEKAGVCVATIDRSTQANSFDFETMEALEHVLAKAESDDDIRGFILTGSGNRFFCAGADMKLVRGLDLRGYADFLANGLHLIQRIQEFPKPTLAAINGLSIGGGSEIALACDFVMASEQAEISFPELSLGMVPGWGGAVRLARLVGQAKAMEILLTGNKLAAEEAERLGLVNRVVPSEDLLPEAQALMQTVLRNSPLAINMTKRMIRSERDVSSQAGEHFEAYASLVTFMSRDGKEGIDSIFAGKKPVWSGK
ncbi:MAG: enoyl-CoA hydratase/isomerase family protein [Desulfobacteraceae bacterium]|jgi:enoyl-CoA hydratase